MVKKGSIADQGTVRACQRCTKGKRACDKRRPACGRCQRLGLQCVFSPESHKYLTRYTPWQHDCKSSALGQCSNPPDGRLETLEISPHDGHASWMNALDVFFMYMYPWFRVGRKSRYRQIVGKRFALRHQREQSSQETPLEVEIGDVLGSCIQLLVSLRDPRSSSDDVMTDAVYEQMKHYWSSLVSCNSDPSIEMMECGLLIALLELTRSKPQLCYRTLSEVATMARLARIRPGKYNVDKGESQSEKEEDERALWWTIYVLDQYVHFHATIRKMPDIAPLSEDDDLLPTSSEVWDGEEWQPVFLELPAKIRHDSTLPGTFQRSAQAAKILCHCRHIADEMAGSATGSLQDLEKANNDLRCLVDAMLRQTIQMEAFCDSHAMCLSSLILLCGPYLAEPGPSSDGDDATTAVKARAIAEAGLSFAVRFLVDISKHFNALDNQTAQLINSPPPAVFACYWAAKHLLRFGQADEDAQAMFDELFTTLETFRKRWKMTDDMVEDIRKSKRLVCQL